MKKRREKTDPDFIDDADDITKSIHYTKNILLFIINKISVIIETLYIKKKLKHGIIHKMNKSLGAL